MKFYFITGLLLLMGAPLWAQTIASDSLVLFLPLNGNANDASGNGYHGVVNGATLAEGPGGAPNSSYYFDGSGSAILVRNLAKLDRPLKAFTILVRLQPQTLQPDPTIQAPHWTTYNFLTWHRNQADSTMAFLQSKMRTAWQSPGTGTEPGKGFLSYVMSWCSSNRGTASGYQKDTSLVRGQWHTVAYVYAEGTLSVYHNCKRENHWPGIYPGISDLCGSEPMQITLGTVPKGAYQYGYRPFKGWIDEVRVYTRALTEQEVHAFAGNNCIEPPKDLNPVIKVEQDPCFPQQFRFTDVTPVDTNFRVLQRKWMVNNRDSSDAAAYEYRAATAGLHNLSLQLVTSRGTFRKDTVLQVPFTGPRRFLQTGASTLSVCEGNEVKVPLQGGVAYQWQPCLYLADCSAGEQVIRPAVTTQYTIVAKDAFSCADTATIQVIVVPDNQPVYVPSGFTPNGDGLNDAFGVLSSQPLADYHLQVYNRWGQVVFETKNQAVKWNGRIKGVSALSGTYIWRLTYTNGNGCSRKEQKGTVLLLN